MVDCVFCKIVEGKLPCYKIYEDDSFLAFLDIYPKNHGHVLAILKKHYQLITDTPDDVLGKFIVLVKKLSKAVEEATKCDGFTISNNNREHGGQEVPHIHFHIIPRYKSDGLKYSWPTQKFTEQQFRETVEKIKKELS